jgi:hypothetical protein
MREQQTAGARPRDVTKRTLILAALATIAFVIAVGVFAMARTSGLLPAPADPHTVAAPIDGLDVAVMESSPPQYMLHIRAGLPSGCAKPDSHSVNRSGARITVTVLNSMLNINLGTDFLSGSTYTVQVNDKATTFTAQ